LSFSTSSELEFMESCIIVGIPYVMTQLHGNIFWANQEIPRSLWNSKFNCHFHKISPLVPILNQINSVYASVLFVDTIFWSTSWFSKWAALDLSFKTLCISLLSVRATCSTPVIPDLISRWYLVNSAILLCKFLQSPVTFFFLAQIYSSAPCFETPSASVHPLIWKTYFHIRMKEQGKVIVSYNLIIFSYVANVNIKDCGPNGNRHFL